MNETEAFHCKDAVKKQFKKMKPRMARIRSDGFPIREIREIRGDDSSNACKLPAPRPAPNGYSSDSFSRTDLFSQIREREANAMCFHVLR
jgi:hypothetical protein